MWGCALPRQEAGCWAAVRGAGCPRARAVPATPRLFDNRLHALPKAAGTARHSQAATATWTEPVDPAWSKVPACSALPAPLCLLEPSELAADPHPISAPGSAWQLPPAAAHAEPWMSRRSRLEPRHMSRAEARSLSEQRPQNSSASCQARDVFPCNVSPERLPMTRLLDIPSPGRAGGTAGALGFAELITPSLITARRRVTCPD